MSSRIILVGGSWGGLRAVRCVLEPLGADLDAGVVVVLHRLAGAQRHGLAQLLQGSSALPVSEVDDKDELVPGRVYVAPADYHLFVEPGGFALSTDERVQHSRPSIDVALESAVDAYGAAVVGVILTGANADGALGLARVKRRGGGRGRPGSRGRRAEDDAGRRARGDGGRRHAAGRRDRPVPRRALPRRRECYLLWLLTVSLRGQTPSRYRKPSHPGPSE